MGKSARHRCVDFCRWAWVLLSAVASVSCALEHEGSGQELAAGPRATVASEEDFARVPDLPNESVLAGLRKPHEASAERAPGGDAFVGVVTSALSKGCGRSCDNKDPATYQLYDGHWYTCADDAFTVDVAWWDASYVELRYSPKCRTVWARSNHLVTDVCGVTITSMYLDGTGRAAAYMPYTTGIGWTPMLDDAGLEGYASIYCAGSGNYTIAY